MSAYDGLHPGVRKWIWRQGWQGLRDVQEQAIPPILDGRADVILAAATAAGKTEAAFLPILSNLAGQAGGSIRALCVSPLKALINDQHERLTGMAEGLDVPVHKWHGDVDGGRKQRLRDQPQGILLITPESLEATFVRRGFEVPGFFRHLAYVVVDELHAFLGTERGRQLQSLLARLEVAIGRRVPRIALSATLGDMGLAREFLRPGEAESVLAVIARERSQQLQLQVRGYRELPPRLAPKNARNLEAQGRPIETEDVTPGDQLAISEHLFETLRGGHHLVFANARSSVETYADLLRRRCERERVPEEFWPHHGSLSKELREHAEERLKDPRRPATLVATTTLELGIDVGSVGSIAQIGVPPSVASMRQRLGRSGRQGGPAVLRVYVQEPEVTDRSSPLDVLRARLIQTVAMVELLLERWVEPPHPAALHLSTLVQQVLSSVAQHGGIRAPQAYHELCREGPFGSVPPERFIALLRCLGDSDLITQTHDGELVLGLTGERITGHFDFYAAFTSPEEFRLVSGGKTLGTLPISDPLYPGAYVVFGGNRWRVLEVDDRRKVVDLAPARGGRVPRFSGDAPGGVHDRVRRRMEEIYRSGHLPPFLDPAARDLLAEGREGYARYGMAEDPFVADGGDTWWIALRGDRILDTLALAARIHGAECRRVGPALQFDELPPEAARRLLADLAASPPPDPLALAAVVENKRTEKFHPFLSDELLTADYAARALDVEGAWEALAAWGGADAARLGTRVAARGSPE